jgi:membrane protease YdiL (CAAX protease family)
MFLEQYYSGKKDAWRYVVGLLIIVVAVLVGQIPMGVYLVVLKEFNPVKAGEFQHALLNISETGINSNTMFLFNLIPFLFGFVAVFLVVKYLHHRKAISVVNGRRRFDSSKFLFAAATWLALNVLTEVLFYLFYPENYVLNFDASLFYPLLIISLILIPFQAAMEELVVRGYLMQAFAGWFKYKWIAILLSSLIFYSLHLSNPEFEEFGAGVGLYYFVFALVAASLAVVDDGLEIPIAIHIMNNIYGALVVSFKGSVFSTATLFKADRIEIGVLLGGWAAMLMVYILLLQFKYKWKNWKTIASRIGHADEPIYTDLHS